MKFADLAPQKDRVLIVDSMNLAFRWKHSKAKQFVPEFISTVKSLATSYKCGTIIIVADQYSSSYRKEIYPKYKDNRRILREKQTEQEAQDFKDFMEEYERVILACREEFTVLRFDHVEADDIAAFVCKKLPNNYIWLISSDKDWDLLITDKVSRFSTVTRKETRIDNWYEHYDVTPEQYISLKVLMGDSGDNIPGIKGFGPKYAKELIDQYGSAIDVYVACPIDSHYKRIQELNSSCKRILLNYELMDLIAYCEDAIGADNCQEISTILKDLF